MELSASAQRVVESRFPSTISVSDVKDVDLEMVRNWAQKFSQVGLVVVGAGPPCQGVSALNASRKGALRDARSSLFVHVSRIRSLVAQCFPWAQVRSLMESVSSMNAHDEEVMNADFGDAPWSIDAAGVSLARRPRLYWLDWELIGGEGATLVMEADKRRQVALEGKIQEKIYLLPGWRKSDSAPLPTFTTSRPSQRPGYKPAGLQQCSEAELQRWRNDQHRFPPYQYRTCFSLVNKAGHERIANIQEREVIMGFPRDYTLNCLPKGQHNTEQHLDTRLSLVGNSWNVTVVTWLLSQLGMVIGLNPPLSVQDVISRTAPGSTKDFQTFLQRPLMTQARERASGSGEMLVRKLLSLVSIKGEDILLQASSEDSIKYHRLRASVPAKLWRWRTVVGWKWKGNREHINVLELRAAFTALRWRIERKQLLHTKFVHLLDSLVSLHALSRGRSSSKKLRRTLLRTNALLLATKSQAVWAYVHTAQNPADAPSRRPPKRKWKNA